MDAESVLATVLREPPGSEEWIRYLMCAEELGVILNTVKTKGALKQLMADRVPDDMMKLSFYGMNWREALRTRVTQHRYDMCCRAIISEPHGEQRTTMVLAVADSMLLHPPKYRSYVSQFAYNYHTAMRDNVREKLNKKDHQWVRSAFEMFGGLQHIMLPEVEHAGESDLMCDLIAGMTRTLHHSVASTVFHTLDSKRIAQAVKKARLHVAYTDALNNHDLRETVRKRDPRVQPLDKEFYDIVLNFESLQGFVMRSFCQHEDIIKTLNALVIMHQDGRISRSELDDARDRLFSMAVNYNKHPVYEYLLEGSDRLLVDRLASVVVPLAMHKRQRL